MDSRKNIKTGKKKAHSTEQLGPEFSDELASKAI